MSQKILFSFSVFWESEWYDSPVIKQQLNTLRLLVYPLKTFVVLFREGVVKFNHYLYLKSIFLRYVFYV